MPKLIDQPRFVCALGAMQTVQGIYRGVPILHAGPGCAAKLAGGLAGSCGDSGYISPQIYPCTNVSDNEIVFGGEERLREIILNTLQVIDGDLFIVLSGCTTEIVGDDIAKVVKSIQNERKPVLFVETAGFKGTNLLGHEWVIDAIITQYLKSRPIKKPIKGLVNIWGPVPSYDPFWIGNIKELETLVSDIGLIPNTIFGEFRGIENINRIVEAECNLLVSPWVGLNNVCTMQELFGIPFLHYPVLPIGAIESSRFLRALGSFTGVEQERVEAVIRKHECEYYYHIERTSDVFLENRTMSRRFSIVSSATDALSISRFLVNDFGLIPGRQYITDATPEEHKERVSGYFKEYDYDIATDVIFSTDGYKIHQEIEDTNYYGNPLIIGSIYEKKLAEKLQGNFLCVSAPLKERLILNGSYVGYQGGLRLLEDIYSYVFKQFN